MYKVEETVERRAVSRPSGKYLAGLSRKMLLPVLIGLAAVSVRAQLLPPSNDNFTNAIPLLGTSGTVRGTTIGATGETNEPPHNSNEAVNSIWFAWTAADTRWYSFDTRGSTDGSGNDLDTVLGIYSGADFGSLRPVFASQNTGDPNDNDPTGSVTSRVTFFTQAGTTYFIAVDSAQDAPPGSVVLNWNSAPNAGTFAFASGVISGQQMYAPGAGVDFPGVGASMPSRSTASSWPAPMSFVAGDGDFFKRLTVTRYGEAGVVPASM